MLFSIFQLQGIRDPNNKHTPHGSVLNFTELF
jgi:hypothetical protein